MQEPGDLGPEGSSCCKKVQHESNDAAAAQESRLPPSDSHGLDIMKISINPFASSENEYISRTNEILAGMASTCALPGVKRAFMNPLSLCAAKCDIAILHWVENTMLDGRGRISRLRTIRLYFYIRLLRLISKRLIMVRHNNYPHDSDHEQIPRIKHLMKSYEKYFDVVVTHSGHNADSGYIYVPHPLYTKAATSGRLIDGDYFFILGRILPYKAIDKLIAHLSPDVHLVVAGKAPDPTYLAKCKELAEGKQVTFITGYLPDSDAANLVTHARGMVVPNSDEDMVVSGNYFFSFSYGVPIFTVQTPFTNWLMESKDPGGLHQYPCISSLARSLFDARTANNPDPEKIEEAFGNSAVTRGWARALAAAE